ncbi:UDP-N-acetylmuramyl pentapeptide phosphotransferase/UDP-N-acetylglucosamine-1-phosphate transferase [Prevotella dentalis DSM 3688]|nr:MraY family glycosyltransferase [Prevotella dentalis]AGB27732.1 UDP-N-acetylmuramyl pentapeptide phosphotransferase/UDP-N-acetylglucosamine-1-phosphate transferase [Prevotella dentalis DSM 3688]
MTLYILLILGALGISMGCGFVAIPVILDYCKEKKLYDIPNSRKMHKTLIPRLGGVSFLPSMLIAFILALLVMAYDRQSKLLSINLWSLYFMVGLLVIYFVGLIDDLIGLGANLKFAAQLIAATVLPLSNLYINNLYGLFGLHEIPFWAGAPLTVLAIVFICNAMNLIDGIDGLCAGLTEIALAGFMYAFYEERIYVYCILIAGLMGALVPYLYYNLWGKESRNRKIFMGDSGSLTLGFILGFLFVKYSMNNPTVMYYAPERMPFAMTLLLTPTFDVVRVVLHRLRTHRPIFDADKNHIHHKFMRLGLSMNQTLVIILSLALSFIVINRLAYTAAGFTFVFILDVLLYTALHLALNYLTARAIKEGRTR